MATLNSAMQTIIDNLHAKMSSGEKLTAEEQVLIASAVQKLGSHATWEQALIAVAEEHLDTATGALTTVIDAANGLINNFTVKVQRGEAVISSSAGLTTTIAAVDPARSFLLVSGGAKAGVSSAYYYSAPFGKISSPTTLFLTLTSFTSNVPAYWEVVEFPA